MTVIGQLLLLTSPDIQAIKNPPKQRVKGESFQFYLCSFLFLSANSRHLTALQIIDYTNTIGGNYFLWTSFSTTQWDVGLPVKKPVIFKNAQYGHFLVSHNADCPLKRLESYEFHVSANSQHQTVGTYLCFVHIFQRITGYRFYPVSFFFISHNSSCIFGSLNNDIGWPQPAIHLT